VLFALLLLPLFAARALAAPAWLDPVNLSAAGQDAARVQVAMNEEGDAVAVWDRFDGSNFRVQATVRPAGGDFSAPVNLSTAGRDAVFPQVAMDQAGSAVAVWQRFDGTDQRVQAAIRPAGGRFSGAVNLSVGGQDATDPQVAMDQAGNAVAVWQRSDGTSTRIQAAFRSAGAGFSSTPVDLSAMGEEASSPEVAMGQIDDAVAVWLRSYGADQRVEAATGTASGGFSMPVPLSDAGEDALGPEVAMNEGGDALAVWERFDGSNQRVQAANRPAGGGFSTDVDLSAMGEDAARPQPAINQEGDSVAVWERFDGTNQRVQTADRPAGGSFSTPLNLSAAGQDADFPELAVDEAGDVVAVFRRFNGANFRVQARVRPEGGAFSAAENLSAAGHDAELPQVAMDEAGDAITGWHRTNGANLIAQAAGYDAVAPQLRNLSVPGSGSTGSPVNFSVSPFEVWGPVSTRWSFGDGASASGKSVPHTYCSAGTRQVKVTATDAVGNSTSATRPISIAASNEFSFGKVKKNKKKGTAKLAVELPGAGELELAKNKKVKGASADATCNGEVSLRVKAKGKAKRKLNKKGKAKVKAKVSFTPTGGSQNTESKKVKLKKR
jgi:hypothetical protein